MGLSSLPTLCVGRQNSSLSSDLNPTFYQQVDLPASGRSGSWGNWVFLGRRIPSFYSCNLHISAMGTACLLLRQNLSRKQYSYIYISQPFPIVETVRLGLERQFSRYRAGLAIGQARLNLQHRVCFPKPHQENRQAQEVLARVRGSSQPPSKKGEPTMNNQY